MQLLYSQGRWVKSLVCGVSPLGSRAHFARLCAPRSYPKVQAIDRMSSSDELGAL